MEFKGCRRIVTGNDPDGRPVVFSDGFMELGGQVRSLWGSDQPPVFPVDGTEPVQQAWVPPPGGFRVALFVIPPSGGSSDGRPSRDPDADLESHGSLDSIVMLEGEAIVRHGNGQEVVLHTGDVLIQNGTFHGWANRGDVPAVGLAFIVGAATNEGA